MSEQERLLKEAKAASEQGEEARVQGLLLDLLRGDPHNASALFMLGGSYFCEEKFAEATVIFEQLVLMFPGDGSASTGLYNSLWNQGKATEAVNEIKRFFQTADPKIEAETIATYKQIIETLSASDSEAPN